MSFSTDAVSRTKGETQILSRFKASLKEDLRTKLMAREFTEHEKAYALVQDLDIVKSNRAFRSHHRAPMSRPPPST